VTDRRTDGIAVARTALAMRALRRAVKIDQAVSELLGLKFTVFLIWPLAYTKS